MGSNLFLFFELNTFCNRARGCSRAIMASVREKDRTILQAGCGIPHQVCTIDR
jgi:hypothetical protein